MVQVSYLFVTKSRVWEELKKFESISDVAAASRTFISSTLLSIGDNSGHCYYHIEKTSGVEYISLMNGLKTMHTKKYEDIRSLHLPQA